MLLTDAAVCALAVAMEFPPTWMGLAGRASFLSLLGVTSVLGGWGLLAFMRLGRRELAHALRGRAPRGLAVSGVGLIGMSVGTWFAAAPLSVAMPVRMVFSGGGNADAVMLYLVLASSLCVLGGYGSLFVRRPGSAALRHGSG